MHILIHLEVHRDIPIGLLIEVHKSLSPKVLVRKDLDHRPLNERNKEK